MPTILKHLDDCKWCPHIRMQHDDETGECLVGKLLKGQCYCIEFEKK